MSGVQTIFFLRPRRETRSQTPGGATPEGPPTPGGDRTPRAEALDGNLASTPGKETSSVMSSAHVSSTTSAGASTEHVAHSIATPPTKASVQSTAAGGARLAQTQQAARLGSVTDLPGSVNVAPMTSRSERVQRQMQCGRVERSSRSRASFAESDRPPAFEGKTHPPRGGEPHGLVAELFAASRVELAQLWNPFGTGWAARKRLEKQLRRAAEELREEVGRREEAERELERLAWGVASRGERFDVDIGERVGEEERGGQSTGESTGGFGDGIVQDRNDDPWAGLVEEVRDFGGQEAKRNEEETSAEGAGSGEGLGGGLGEGLARDGFGRRSASWAKTTLAAAEEERATVLQELRTVQKQYRLSLSGGMREGAQLDEQRELQAAANSEEASGSASVTEDPIGEPTSTVDKRAGDQHGATIPPEQSVDSRQVASSDLAAQSVPPTQKGGELSPRAKGVNGGKRKQLRRKGVLINPEGKIPASVNLREPEQKHETEAAVEGLPAHLDLFRKEGETFVEQIRRQLAEETFRREEAERRLSQSESAVQERENRVEELERKLKEAETEEEGAKLTELEAELEAREKRLAASGEERDRQLTTAAAELEEKERRLVDQLKEKEKESEEKERGLRIQFEEKENDLRTEFATKETGLRAQFKEKERALDSQFEEKEKDLQSQLEEKERWLQETIAQLGQLEGRLQAANAQMGQLERDTEEEIETKVAAAFTLIESFKAEKAMLERAVEEADARAHAAARARERAEERAAAAEDSLVETKRELIEMRGKMSAWLERSEAQANEIRAAERTVTETLTERARAPPKKANRKGRKGSGADRGPPKGLSLEIPDGGGVAGGPISGRRARRPFESPLQSPRAGSVAQTPQGVWVAKSPRPGSEAQNPWVGLDAQNPRAISDAPSPRAVPDAPHPRAVSDAQSPRPGVADARTPGKFSVVHAPWAESDAHGLRTLLSAQTPRTGSDAKSPRTHSDAKSPRSYSDATSAAGGSAWDPAQSPVLKKWPIQGGGSEEIK
ncbi:hypothetical protein KFL_003460125 [Klebsormidium nitens]|uniref:Uncharacterized protein n=1 Tax=Klebsormidium nitens TaxID=105231 RepID=A0A1Y1I9V4_KLENI|nr:hypothetical protein KFL_003460125 [Klebsormidium nitens]|eukprot:GAQ87343.1 hypothetical protein KFL_003460125 [Klebsormidium nitens]